MHTNRNITRYHSISNEFREFCAGCDNYFTYYGDEKHYYSNGVSRCKLLSIKRECNSQNCPLWDYDSNYIKLTNENTMPKKRRTHPIQLVWAENVFFNNNQKL